ncbi:hypothetical protein THAOC_35109 [Thalassiosira oceanica]|uniref:SAM-dependent MTase RsmB/NOP-type domain-containing protein n=1 Tax=Thalassiosira oceanica TaxID=159749 RepID=K0RI22_THAOC|nr:hypothetical protein THAOC_35109 [Thalassiosira oceanica]|eukprot:EJK46232.1 hypothetical protein THAOC_35109 [Thalassiosira oceanica]
MMMMTRYLLLALLFASVYAFNFNIAYRTARSSNRAISTTKLAQHTKQKKNGQTARHVAANSIAKSTLSSYASCASSGSGADQAAPSFAARQLEQDPQYDELEQRDRAFARLLVATVERRLGQIDKTPPFAAVQETVQALKVHRPRVPEPMTKFVNGVLRKLSRPVAEDEGLLFGELLLKKTSADDNVAPWLVQQWKHDWGEEITKLICDEMIPIDELTVKSRIDISTKYSPGMLLKSNDDLAEQEKLAMELGEDTILLPQGSIRVGQSLKGDIKSWARYDEGKWWVQDASSTLAAIALSSALNDRYPDPSLVQVVDMCSAPGGKAAQLCSTGYNVTAIEASRRRTDRLKENLDRLEFTNVCEVVVGEGQHWKPTTSVHGILLDVPCSATGTGGRRPDVLRRSSGELLEIQQTLACHCVDILDEGGILVYATCSLLKAESEDQVSKLLSNGLVDTLPIKESEVPGFEDSIDSNGWLRVIPGTLDGALSSTDGFFVASCKSIRSQAPYHWANGTENPARDSNSESPDSYNR